MLKATIGQIFENNFCQLVQKHWREREKEEKQEVGDNLSVCVMNILPKVSSLPNLLAINLMKMER